MKPTIRTTIHIRRDDEEIFSKLSQLGFGEFVSDMMNEHGPDYIDNKVKAEVKKLEKIRLMFKEVI